MRISVEGWTSHSRLGRTLSRLNIDKVGMMS